MAETKSEKEKRLDALMSSSSFEIDNYLLVCKPCFVDKFIRYEYTVLKKLNDGQYKRIYFYNNGIKRIDDIEKAQEIIDVARDISGE
jgi:hypothetical protein